MNQEETLKRLRERLEMWAGEFREKQKAKGKLIGYRFMGPAGLILERGRVFEFDPQRSELIDVRAANRRMGRGVGFGCENAADLLSLKGGVPVGYAEGYVGFLMKDELAVLPHAWNVVGGVAYDGCLFLAEVGAHSGPWVYLGVEIPNALAPKRRGGHPPRFVLDDWKHNWPLCRFDGPWSERPPALEAEAEWVTQG